METTALTAILMRNGSTTDLVRGSSKDVASEITAATAAHRFARFTLADGRAMSVSTDTLRVRTVAV